MMNHFTYTFSNNENIHLARLRVCEWIPCTTVTSAMVPTYSTSSGISDIPFTCFAAYQLPYLRTYEERMNFKMLEQ